MLNNYSAILGCVGLKCWYTIAFVGCVWQTMHHDDWSGLRTMWVFPWFFPTRWLVRAPPRSPSTATGGDTTGTWVGRTPRRSTAAARIKWLVRGLDWGGVVCWGSELGGGSKYIYNIYIYIVYLFILHLYVLECIWDELHKCPMYSIYIYLYVFVFLGHGLNMIEPQARCWWSHHYFAEKLPSGLARFLISAPDTYPLKGDPHETAVKFPIFSG